MLNGKIITVRCKDFYEAFILTAEMFPKRDPTRYEWKDGFDSNYTPCKVKTTAYTEPAINKRLPLFIQYSEDGKDDYVYTNQGNFSHMSFGQYLIFNGNILIGVCNTKKAFEDGYEIA